MLELCLTYGSLRTSARSHPEGRTMLLRRSQRTGTAHGLTVTRRSQVSRAATAQQSAMPLLRRQPRCHRCDSLAATTARGRRSRNAS